MYYFKRNRVSPKSLIITYFISALAIFNSCSNDEIITSEEYSIPINYSGIQLSCEREISLTGGESIWENLESIQVISATNSEKMNSNGEWESISDGTGTYDCKGLRGDLSFLRSGTFDVGGEEMEIECNGVITIGENIQLTWSNPDSVPILNVENAQVLNESDEWISIDDTTSQCINIKGFRVQEDSLGQIKFYSSENQIYSSIKWERLIE
ncbi:MAG: hypothetical protein DWQ06_15470 [Calditrichaeota bacterium]|nr:MAG: hypothetical protein DWQ06_15470 [Calditrichota bacterium]